MPSMGLGLARATRKRPMESASGPCLKGDLFRANIVPFPGRKAVETRLRTFEVGGRTPLYETIGEGVEHLLDNWRDGSVNALIVVTDGQEQPTERVLTEQERVDAQQRLDTRVRKARQRYTDDRPIYVLVTAVSKRGM